MAERLGVGEPAPYACHRPKLNGGRSAIEQSSVVAPNSGAVVEMRAGQFLRVSGTTITDFIVLNRRDLRDGFSQGRTKAEAGRIFVSTGDWLVSRRHNRLMQIVQDEFREGTHDLQFDFCSRQRYVDIAQAGDFDAIFKRHVRREEIPDHGCWENMSKVLEPFGLAPEDIPAPLNLFQHMKIDGATGRMEHTTVRPGPGTSVVFRALVDCLAAMSACPDLVVGGREVHVTLFDG